MPDRKLHVFLCHASQDKPIVRELYQRLLAEGWIDPWLDEEKLLPGQDWDLEIERAVESADAVIVCLSTNSVTKEGYIQRELKFVLDIALEKPEGTIFIIPLRLDDCDLPRRLRSWQYVDYFPTAERKRAYQRLLQSLHLRYGQSKSDVANKEETPSVAVTTSGMVAEKKKPAAKNDTDSVVVSSQSRGGGNANVGGSILSIIYFAFAALDKLASSSDIVESMLAISAILAGIVFVARRQIPTSVIFKISLIIYLLIYGLGYRLTNDFPVLFYVAGTAAVISGIMLAVTIRVPGKPAFYSSISFAAFLFLVATYEIATNIDYSSFTTAIDTLILITSIIASLLLWMDL